MPLKTNPAGVRLLSGQELTTVMTVHLSLDKTEIFLHKTGDISSAEIQCLLRGRFIPV